MPQPSSPASFHLHNYLPPCQKCGALMQLARIEPADQPGHDLRTFECCSCGSYEEVKIRFR